MTSLYVPLDVQPVELHLQKAWSESARQAAIEARRANSGKAKEKANEGDHDKSQGDAGPTSHNTGGGLKVGEKYSMGGTRLTVNDMIRMSDKFTSLGYKDGEDWKEHISTDQLEIKSEKMASDPDVARVLSDMGLGPSMGRPSTDEEKRASGGSAAARSKATERSFSAGAFDKKSPPLVIGGRRRISGSKY